MRKIIFLLFLAAVVFLPGCSGEKKPKVVLKETKTEEIFTGRIVCPSCRATLTKEDMKPLNQVVFRCLKCQKPAPKINFYPDAKKTR